MRRSWRRRLLVLLATVVVVPFVGSLVYRQWVRSAGEARLRRLETDLDRTDPGWRLDDLVAARNAVVPPDEQNLTKLCWDIHDAKPDGFNRWAAGRADWLPSPEVNRLPAADALEDARAVFAQAGRAVELARTARRRPRGGWKLVVPANPLDTSLEHTRRVRSAAGLLELDAVLAAVSGDPARAADATADVLHLCHAVGDEPLLISQLVRLSVAGRAVDTAERLVGWGEPPAERLAVLQAGFLAEAEFPRLAAAFRGERAFFHRLFAGLDANRLTLAQLSGDPDQVLSGYGRWRFATYLPADQAYSLDFHTRLLAITPRPPHEQIDEFAAVERPPKVAGSTRSRLFLPALDKVTQVDWRTTARLRSAAAGLACERFRQRHQRWPTDLAELKELLPAIPLDPYDGQPLRFAKLADGVVVYSVGPDRQDDGGTLSYGQPQPGEDVGFRLWDVAVRRQPAVELTEPEG